MEDLNRIEKEPDNTMPLSDIKSRVVIKYNVINEFLASKGKELKVDISEINTSFYPVQVTSHQDKIHTIVQSEGRISASIELIFLPFLQHSTLRFKLLDISMGASKSIHKIAFRLAKNQIQKKIQERLDFEIGRISKVIEKAILPGIQSSGQQIGLKPTLRINGIEISKFTIEANEIDIHYNLNFESQVEIQNLDKIWTFTNKLKSPN